MRYATFGFMHEANLDKGNMWPTAFALKKVTAAKRGNDRCACEESGELRMKHPPGSEAGVNLYYRMVLRGMADFRAA